MQIERRITAEKQHRSIFRITPSDEGEYKNKFDNFFLRYIYNSKIKKQL